MRKKNADARHAVGVTYLECEEMDDKELTPLLTFGKYKENSNCTRTLYGCFVFFVVESVGNNVYLLEIVYKIEGAGLQLENYFA